MKNSIYPPKKGLPSKGKIAQAVIHKICEFLHKKGVSDDDISKALAFTLVIYEYNGKIPKEKTDTYIRSARGLLRRGHVCER